MNNRMSYNDVEQLKRQIKARLGGAVNDVMNMANGIPNGVPKSVPYGGVGQRNRPLQGNGQMRPPQGSRQMISPQGAAPKPMKSSMTPPAPMQSPDMRTQPVSGGAHFDKYDCGHDYPKMSLQQHIRSELDTDNRRKAENLQYAVVMSEILGEPVSRKRRKRRRAVC